MSEPGDVVTGSGPAWPAVPEPLPDAPKWHEPRAFAGVWRDSLPMALGGFAAARRPEFQEARVDLGWNPSPEPDSDQDVMQAVGAKAHLAFRFLSVLAGAQLVQLEPGQAALIPDWDDPEQAFRFAARMELPASPLFLDFESAAGSPTAWHADTWPLEFHLRGALLWRDDDAVYAIPFGSVGGVHPYGGTDYQAWTRWTYWQRPDTQPPDPGPGDVVSFGEGLTAWVEFGESICTHMAAVGYNLMARVLRVLWAIETLGLEPTPPNLPRAERRRAARANSTIGLVVGGLPELRERGDAADSDDLARWGEMLDSCPVQSCHARFIEAHTYWHEALAAYDDPGQFMVRLNALIQAMRNITFALQKEIAHNDALADWYAGWQLRMRADPKLKWAVAARNQIVKQGDLAAHSTARAWIAGDRVTSQPVEMNVPPTRSAAEIARSIQLPGLDDTIRREGTLMVERRWVVDEFPDDELLDLLAHNLAFLGELVTDAHHQLGTSIRTCEKNLDDPCGPFEIIDSGRLGCMAATTQLRTSQRNLSDGAPIRIGIASLKGPSISDDELGARYPDLDPDFKPIVDLFHEAAHLHRIARGMMAVDGGHVSIAWTLRNNEILGQLALNLRNQRELFLTMDALAKELR